jgi:hypothetical protein
MGKMLLKCLRVSLVLFLSLLLIFLSMNRLIAVESAQQTTVQVEPSANFALVDETFNINVIVSNVQNLYGLEATVYWNASILNLVKVDIRLGKADGILYNSTAFPLLELQNETFQQQGRYVLAESSTAPAPSFNGTGNIVTLTFNVVRVGSCELSLDVELASNIITETGAAPIAHTTINGFFGPIQIIAYPETVSVGDNVTISGLVAPAQAGVPVQFLYRSDNKTIWLPLANSTTDEHGNYSYTWRPEEAGDYHVKALAVLLDTQEASPEISISVSEPEQSEWLYIGILIIIVAVVGAVMASLLVNKLRRGRRGRSHWFS